VVNQEIFQEAEKLGVLLNAVDDLPRCSFIAPSIVKRGPVTLAISTGGASPALARKLRETLTDSRDLQWADATGVLSKARQVIKDEQVAIDPQRWQCCMTSDFLALAKSGREDEAMEVLLDGLLGKDSKGKCSNIAECVSGGCQVRKQSRHNSAENRNGQDRGGLTP
jgi:precorrin-2 dehydrogenase/sirohydrochlorin ferrochelatase